MLGKINQWDDLLAVIAAVRQYLEFILPFFETLTRSGFRDNMLCDESSGFVRSSESKLS